MRNLAPTVSSSPASLGLRHAQRPHHDRTLAACVLCALVLSMTGGLRADEAPLPPALAAADAPARALLARMTLEEEIGQMVQPDQHFLRSPDDIERFALGSLLSGGGSGPPAAADYTLAGWTAMVDAYQRHALRTRLAIPLLYGVDAVHGHNNIPGAVVFPHAIGMGCTHDPALVEAMARVTAEEVRATGITWVFAPCLAVPQDERWGRTYEGFSNDPELVGALGGAAVRGFQGERLDDPLRVLACAKHFAGDGGTAFGSVVRDGRPGLDQGDTRCDEATFRRLFVDPYRPAIAAGVGSIMPSYSSWNGVKCTGNAHLLTGILKQDLGFAGFLISDYNAIDQLGPDYADDACRAVTAGIDMIMVTDRYPELIADLLAAARSGRLTRERIADAVLRILRVKIALGLMDPQRPPFADRRLWAAFGSPAHRAVARRCVAASLVVLKNQGAALPIPGTARILVAGEAARDLGRQCGGWTISWQGAAGQPIPGGTTVLAAIQAAAPGAVAYSADARAAATAEVGIAVVGERPYAEYRGDHADLALDAEEQSLVARLRAQVHSLVVVVLCGRPLVLGPAMDVADAVVAAWLPGSEGDGVADVLFGAVPARGRLCRPWPLRLISVPAGNPAAIPVAASGPDSLPAGFGLATGGDAAP